MRNGQNLISWRWSLPLPTDPVNNYEFLHNFYSRVANDDWSAAQLLEEILRIRDDDFKVLFGDGGRLSTSELNCILSYVASSRS